MSLHTQFTQLMLIDDRFTIETHVQPLCPYICSQRVHGQMVIMEVDLSQGHMWSERCPG